MKLQFKNIKSYKKSTKNPVVYFDEAIGKIKEMAKNYGKENDEEFAKNENVRNYIKQGLESEKAIEFLVKNAKMK